MKFFYQYVSGDCIGLMSTAHLVYADYHGLYEEICMNIAVKAVLAVDFPKSGKPPDRLKQEEKVTKSPDYKENESKPMYKSKRLLGKLYR